MELIQSPQNPRIRRILTLQAKRQAREREGCFVVEGRREVEHCMRAGYEAESVYVVEGIEQPEGVSGRAFPVYTVSQRVYEKIAYRGGTEGVLAVVKKPVARTLEELTLPSAPLIVVVESVEKPGNLGALLRTADAAGVDLVVVCDPLTDLYNPNLIRNSLGAVFTVACVAATTPQTIQFLQRRAISILTAQLQDSELYYDTPMTGGTAIVVGTESTGLTNAWRNAATSHIRIPMLGQLDSLNVSVSAAILIYEAVRQRTQARP